MLSIRPLTFCEIGQTNPTMYRLIPHLQTNTIATMNIKEIIPWGIFASCTIIIVSVLMNVIFLSEPNFSVNRTRATSYVLIAQSVLALVCIALNLYIKEGTLLERGSFYYETVQGKFLLFYDIFIFAGFVSSSVLVYVPNNTGDWTQYNIAASFLVGVRAGILLFSELRNFDSSMSHEEQAKLTDELEKQEPLLTTEIFTIDEISDSEEVVAETNFSAESKKPHKHASDSENNGTKIESSTKLE